MLGSLTLWIMHIMLLSLVLPQQVIRSPISIFPLHFYLLLQRYSHYTLHIHPFSCQSENICLAIHSLSLKSQVLLNGESGQSSWDSHLHSINIILINQLVSQSINQSPSQSARQQASQSVIQLCIWSLCHLVNQATGQVDSQSVKQSPKQSASKPNTKLPIQPTSQKQTDS